MQSSKKYKKIIGMLAVCFGAGIFLAFVLPGRTLAFIEAGALLTAGFLLLNGRC